MLILEILVGWCILSVPAALLVGAALYRNSSGQGATVQSRSVRQGPRSAQPAA